MAQGCITLNLDLMRKYQITHTEGIVTQCYLIREAAGSSFAIRIEAGLPNIGGQFGNITSGKPEYPWAEGAFNVAKQFRGHQNGGAQWMYCSDFDFNASRSSSIYGSSTTVTPLSITTSFLMKY